MRLPKKKKALTEIVIGVTSGAPNLTKKSGNVLGGGKP